MDDDAAARAREYYRAIDEGDYEALAGLLAPGFVQERPDLTLEGRDRFVQFMREERPRTDTSHTVETIYVEDGGAAPGTDVAVRGRLCTADGELLARYVDVFTDGDEGFTRLETYTR
jgi:ketosteroid isomerase-like protein